MGIADRAVWQIRIRQEFAAAGRPVSFASGAALFTRLPAYRFFRWGHGSSGAGGAPPRRGTCTPRGRIPATKGRRDVVGVSAPRVSGDLEQGQLSADSRPGVRPVRGDVFA